MPHAARTFALFIFLFSWKLLFFFFLRSCFHENLIVDLKNYLELWFYEHLILTFYKENINVNFHTFWRRLDCVFFSCLCVFFSFFFLNPAPLALFMKHEQSIVQLGKCTMISLMNSNWKKKFIVFNFQQNKRYPNTSFVYESIINLL